MSPAERQRHDHAQWNSIRLSEKLESALNGWIASKLLCQDTRGGLGCLIPAVPVVVVMSTDYVQAGPREIFRSRFQTAEQRQEL